jgi:GNAT superfamily N-acetyltransferase
MGISIRPATAADAQVIAQQRQAMFADMNRGTPAEIAAMGAVFLRQVQRMLDAGEYYGWLACTDEGHVVAGGGLIVHEWVARVSDPNTRRAYILNVYTEPAYRRQGLARQIMQTMIDWARAQGFVTVSLHASQAGRPLYELLGFEPTNEMRLKLQGR